MNKLAVVCPAFYPDESYIQPLKASCERMGVPLFPFGLGQPWCWDMLAHFTHAPAAIEALPSEYDVVMFTDGHDAFLAAGEQEIVEKFKRSGARLLLSAEGGLYPWGLEGIWAARRLDQRASNLWRFPNGGGWIGYRNDLLSVLPQVREQDWQEAQGCWIKAYCAGELGIRLDTECEIFQTMSHGSGDHLDTRDGRWHNWLTGAAPCVLHFNGRAGNAQEYYEKLLQGATA